MTRKIIWMMVSCLMVAVLVLASCGQAEEEEEVTPPAEEEEEVTPPEEEEPPEEPEMVRDVLGRLIEKPRYGGMLRQVMAADTVFTDQVKGYECGTTPWIFTQENLLIGDYVKGPGGTNDASYLVISGPLPVNFYTGLLAESWEVPDSVTIVYHIRQGVHWALNPQSEASRLANGRELTADDVAFSLERIWKTPTSYIAAAFPYDQYLESVTATDKYTVVVKLKSPDRIGKVFITSGDNTEIVPRDVIEKYGDMIDWRNNVGTGPFMWIDYIKGSSMTFERNPNYWRNDPLLPDNQLPYLDSVTLLIIPDPATQLSALRTGKADMLGVTWEDAADLKQRSPELKYIRSSYTVASGIVPRVDKPELPCYDVRIRQALSMAIDYQEILDTYYGGEADLITWPVCNLPEFKNIFTPFEQLPESIKELYVYNPDKAKQLLAEAGYPDGFQMNVITWAYPAYIDLVSIIKDMWAKVGVELVVDVKDYGVFNSMTLGKTVPESNVGPRSGDDPYILPSLDAGSIVNYGNVNDPQIQDALAQMDGLFFDVPQKEQIARDLNMHILEQVYSWCWPTPYTYVFYQPWLHRYNGERSYGYCNLSDYIHYLWIDQDLKEKMTGQR